MGSRTVSGALLPTGINRKIEPVLVDGVDSIQTYVGGMFDCVTQVMPDNTVMVGYIHDEGMLLNLEMNWFASALFMRELHGPVVLVSGSSPSGEYDGENYDIPTHIYAWLISNFTEKVADTYNESVMVTALLNAGVELGVITVAEKNEMYDLIASATEGGDQYEAKEMLDEIMERLEEWAMNNSGAELANEIEDFLKGKQA